MLIRLLRSPFFSMILFVLVISVLFVINLDLTLNRRWIANLFLILALAMTVLWFILVVVHNHKHPKHQIDYSGIIPTEFREMDEGQQWITFKACRNVYVYYSFALPTAALVCGLLKGYPLLSIPVIGLLGIGQYTVYLLTIRKINQY